MYVHRRIEPNERFRERRRRARRRARIRRAAAVGSLIALAAGIALGASFIGGGGGTPERASAGHRTVNRVESRPGAPREIRGVHVTLGLASIPGKLGEYLALHAWGLNTVELDVKDENGRVGFESPSLPELATEAGAPGSFYDASAAVRAAHRAGIYLVGRVVSFADPTLAPARPELALQWPDGTAWRDPAGLAWLNPYDRRVWRYVVGVAAAAAKAGFDEIQFDYVRFPSDGDLASIVYPRRTKQSMARTIAGFLGYASRRLHPLGVNVSADLFGLAATRDLGVGQSPRLVGRYLDTLYPMVYPSHYVKGEYHIVEPEAFPGRTVGRALVDWKRDLRGLRVRIVPWIQDFSLRRPYGLMEVTDQIRAARREGVDGFMLWNPRGVYTTEALAPR